MNLSDALSIFSDNIAEIKSACVENMLWNASQSKPFSLEHKEWSDELVKLELEQKNQGYRITFDRIVAIQEHKRPSRAMNEITDIDIERARDYPIKDMIETRLFKGGGGRLTAHCPFHHEKTPSFYIYKDNRWSCFGACGEHGDAIDFYMKKHQVSFKTAVRVLSKK